MANKSKAVEANPRVIKRASCKSLSKKSELIYVLAIDEDDDLVIRILGNDGGGFHSTEPVKVSKIIETLEAMDADQTFSSRAVGNLFRGQSANNRSFLMAVLREENIVKPIDGQQRKFHLGDIKGFLSRAEKIQSGKAAPQKKPPAKSKAAPKEKPAAKAAPSPAKGKKKSA